MGISVFGRYWGLGDRCLEVPGLMRTDCIVVRSVGSVGLARDEIQSYLHRR